MGDTTASETGATTDEPSTTAAPAAATEPAAPVQLPSDHPLVKAYEATKAELKAVRDAEKTDLQRASDDLAAERERSAGLETELNQLRAALKHKLDPEDIDLLGVGTAEEIEARAKRLAERGANTKKQGGHVPNEGGSPNVATGDMAEFTRHLFDT